MRRLSLVLVVATSLVTWNPAGLPGHRLDASPRQDPPPKSADEPKPRPDQKPEPAEPPLDADEIDVVTDLADLVAAHNKVRAEQDPPLDPLKVDPKLTEAARIHALDMARHAKMSHEGSDDSTPPDRVKRTGYLFDATAENVAMGYREIDGLMDGWMNSPGHRANILGKFTQVGVARGTRPDGTPYWAAVFGTPRILLEPAKASADLIAAVNRVRAEAGKRALKPQAKLQAAAQSHARANARRGGLPKGAEDGPSALDRVDASGYRYARLGETNAAGYPTGEEVVSSWMKDEGHESQLLGDFTEIGAGYASAEDGQPYWTLILARPRR